MLLSPFHRATIQLYQRVFLPLVEHRTLPLACQIILDAPKNSLRNVNISKRVIRDFLRLNKLTCMYDGRDLASAMGRTSCGGFLFFGGFIFG